VERSDGTAEEERLPPARVVAALREEIGVPLSEADARELEATLSR
jgi:hypothetical protein